MKTWLLLSAFFFFSCNYPGNDAAPVFFSVKSYMEEQAQLLSRQKVKIKKTVVSKGAEETKVIEQPEWDKELQAFMECDLNRPGWSASYKTDSLHRDDLLTIQYTALEPRLQGKRCCGRVRECRSHCRRIEARGPEPKGWPFALVSPASGHSRRMGFGDGSPRARCGHP